MMLSILNKIVEHAKLHEGNQMDENTQKTTFKKVSSCFLGIDRKEVREYWLDLCIPVVRETVRERLDVKYYPNFGMSRIEATWDDLSGLNDYCGDMTNYGFSFFIKETNE